jgi:hypothetical protein
MPRVNRGFNFVQPGGKSYNTTKNWAGKKKPKEETRPLIIYAKYPGRCVICHKHINKNVKVHFNNWGIWHLKCEREGLPCMGNH